METKIFEINSVEELSQVTDLLLSWRDKSDIIAFYGPMGAGKTTLIKNLCHRMGVTDEVNSPTFALVNEYLTENDSIFHFDFYRIKKLEEVFDIGYEDYFYSGHLCLLEWPELIDPLMPEHFIKVEIALGNTDTSRTIKCSVL
ncbi:MAG: tRNA (adenosine(37)-N6)-threonylcarbamoyltransferase complex ATPase subunit type 1 TsaE [Bacteroidales bacterium]|nr:tRNA (adenosine(37)-N6)-threonylcarbamoyltransferase complex ATPase subunit type 1 TsaE [Bacteroidales bacterium]